MFFNSPKMVGYALKFASLFIAFTHALIGPDTLNSSLSILIHNDLTGKLRVRGSSILGSICLMNGTESASPWANSGVLLLDPMPFHEAINRCHALGENLWSVEDRFEQIRYNIQYLVFEQKYNIAQAYWVAPVNSHPTTFDGNGEVNKASVDAVLPVLCTQTAPYARPTTQDTSPPWQVFVRSNNESITGSTYLSQYSNCFLTFNIGFAIDAVFVFSEFGMATIRKDGHTRKSTKGMAMSHRPWHIRPCAYRCQEARKTVCSSTSGRHTFPTETAPVDPYVR